ncbi:holo-ACP synthase [Rothia sp. LK2588]|uniref:holo-ACP synthase n=1 Tax=Rothia sp. LK2588 TaxID=3114369 RepID=UPI0034CD79C7
MIIGTGVDVVNIDRFRDIIARNPGFVQRVFVAHEQTRPLRSLAARFAVKEAVAKALGAPDGMVWQHCWVTNGIHGAPEITCTGTVAARAAALGINRWHVSITHDDPVAMATVIAEHLSPAEFSLLYKLDPQPRGLVQDESDEQHAE